MRIFPAKVFYGALAIAFLLIGLLGLIIPIIPGVIFLVLAVLVASRVSRRVRRWSDEQPLMRRIRRRTSRLAHVNWGARVRVGMLMTLEAMVQTANSAASLFRRRK